MILVDGIHVRVSAHGEVAAGTAHYAEERIRSLAGRSEEPVSRVEVRLTADADQVAHRQVIAQVNLELAGVPVRIQVAGGSGRQAVDALCDELASRLARAAGHGSAPAGPERTGTRPYYRDRPVQEREITGRKTVTPAVRTVDGAAAEMDQLGYDFHLFAEAGTGQDSVLCRIPGGLRLDQVYPRPDRIVHGAVPVLTSTRPAPRLSVGDAVRAMDRSGAPHLFFVDAEWGRGRVLYRRYDGHYGLITAA